MNVAKWWLSNLWNKKDCKKLRLKTIQSKHCSAKSTKTKWLSNSNTIRSSSNKLSFSKELRLSV